MKKLMVLLGLLACSPAFAGLAVVNGHFVQGNPPGTCTITSSVGAGQVIVAYTTIGAGTPAITDSVNSGSYSQLASYSSPKMAIYWIKTNASGTPTLTMTGSSGYAYLGCFAVTGFTGTPTSDAAIINTATGTGTTLAINATNNHNNEIMITQVGISYTQSVTVSGWTAGASSQIGFYSIEATPTTNNFSGTWGSSQTWYLLLAGIYDAGGATCIHAGITSAGAIAVPTAGSTVVRLKNGSFGTVDCSTVSYFQPTVGNFGTGAAAATLLTNDVGTNVLTDDAGANTLTP